MRLKKEKAEGVYILISKAPFKKGNKAVSMTVYDITVEKMKSFIIKGIENQ